MRRVLRLVPLALAAASFGGCALGGGSLSGSGEAPALPPCDEAPGFVFQGETTLAALDLADTVGPGEANRVGQVWVTEPFAPSGMGPGAPLAARWLCVEFDDGSGMGTTLPDDWQPPGSTLALEGGGSPLPVLATLGLALAVVVISVLAFRRG